MPNEMNWIELWLGMVIGIYILMVLWMGLGLLKINKFNSTHTIEKQSFSIIIAFRNESENLPYLLSSISRLKYPFELFEIIMVDDFSDDFSSEIIDNFKLKNPQLNLKVVSNLRKSKSPKKDAIVTAIALSRSDWIFTTDADCELSENSLKITNEFIHQYHPYFIAGPVQYQSNNSFIAQFQMLDWLSLTGFTLSGFGWQKPMICSGANLIYRKDIFNEIGGFEGNQKIASGDDVFLLQKFYTKYPEKTHYLFSSENVVITKPLKNWNAIFEQHKRWVAKTGSVKNKYLKIIGLMVFTTNLSWIFSLFGIVYHANFYLYFLAFSSLKLLTDSLFLMTVSHKIKQPISIRYLIISNFLYPPFSVLVSLLGFTSDFNWKERKFRK